MAPQWVLTGCTLTRVGPGAAVTRTPTGDPDVTDNPSRHRYEIVSGDELAGFALYRDAGGRRVFTHTEVAPAHQGQGLASRLTRAALDDVRRKGLRVVPDCPFMAAYIGRHPHDADLVDDDPTAP